MQKLGRHLIVEFYGCNPEMLDNFEGIKKNMMVAAEKTGATIVGEMFHRFSPHGVSGAVVIAESHLTIHTWPEYGYAALDFYTCGDYTDPWKAFHHMKEVLGADREIVKEIDRGIPDDITFDMPVVFKPSDEVLAKDDDLREEKRPHD